MLGEKYRYWGVGMLLVTITKVVERLKQGDTARTPEIGRGLPHPGLLSN